MPKEKGGEEMRKTEQWEKPFILAEALIFVGCLVMAIVFSIRVNFIFLWLLFPSGMALMHLILFSL